MPVVATTAVDVLNAGCALTTLSLGNAGWLLRLFGLFISRDRRVSPTSRRIVTAFGCCGIVRRQR